MEQQDIQSESKKYPLIFGSLIVLAVVTVAVSYFRPPMGFAIVAALAVAIVMAGIQAGFFMHLISEKKSVIYIMGLAGFFFLAVLLIPFLESRSVPEGTVHPKGGRPTPIHGGKHQAVSAEHETSAAEQPEASAHH